MSIIAQPRQSATYQRSRPVRLPARQRPALDPMSVQNEGYNVTGAMALQRANLQSIQSLDKAGDLMRAQLAEALRDQRTALADGDYHYAKRLNHVALVLLGQVDALDEAEDADPVEDARRHNWEAAQSGRRLIAMTEAEIPPELMA